MTQFSFQVSVPTDDDGFIGRACDSKDCGQYFKVFVQDHRDDLYCPYCATRFSKNELLTDDQHNYLVEVAKEETRAYAAKELQKVLKSAFGGSSSRQSGITYKPGHITKHQVHPRYAEREVDTELQCPECNTRFQVYGIFGYCPGCRAENLRIYEANWEIIKKEVDAAENPARALRHAYGDLVSTFENFCRRKAAKLTKESCNFQELFEARKFFKTHAGVDILDGLSTSALLALRRVFYKRHAYVHSGGQITDRYVRMVPEDSKLLGQQATLDFAELKEAATAMSSALAILVKSTEKQG
jgi:Zn finger protein HypA/HybF involved in hydrogenase expression